MPDNSHNTIISCIDQSVCKYFGTKCVSHRRLPKFKWRWIQQLQWRYVTWTRRWSMIHILFISIIHILFTKNNTHNLIILLYLILLEIKPCIALASNMFHSLIRVTIRTMGAVALSMSIITSPPSFSCFPNPFICFCAIFSLELARSI